MQSMWRRQWQPTPVLLSVKSRGQGSLVGHGSWGRRESDMTEVTEHACMHACMQSVCEDTRHCFSATAFLKIIWEA